MTLATSQQTSDTLERNFQETGARTRSRERDPMSTLRIIRLALSGALAGVAVVGLLFGGSDSFSADIWGAGAGFAGALATLKALHLL
jgi:hypothetical protein